MANDRTDRRIGRRGSAMVEMALVLPFLMFVLLLMVFFGHSMVRKQDTIVTARHLAWREAKSLGLLPPDQIVEQHYPEPANQAPTLELESDGGTPADAAQGLVDAAAEVSQPAGEFADAVVLGHFPGGQRVGVTATFPKDVVPLDQFSKVVGSRHGREGVPWQHGDTDIWEDLTDQFIVDFDNQVSNPGGPLSKAVRELYLRRW